MEEIDYVIGNSDKNAIVNFIEDIENRTMEKVKNSQYIFKIMNIQNMSLQH